MTWWKVDDRADENPKLRGLSSDAFRLWFDANCLAARALTDGRISDGDAALLGVRIMLTPRKGAKLAAELEAAGLWDRVRGGWIVHDWLIYNPPADDVKRKRDEATERMRQFRERRSRDRARSASRDTDGDASRSHTPGPGPGPEEPDVGVAVGSAVESLEAALAAGKPPADAVNGSNPLPDPLSEALGPDGAHLLRKAARKVPGFASITPGQIDRIKRDAGGPVLLEALLRLDLSTPETVESGPAYLDGIVSEVCREMDERKAAK